MECLLNVVNRPRAQWRTIFQSARSDMARALKRSLSAFNFVQLLVVLKLFLDRPRLETLTIFARRFD
jgi:hypothetical protein